MMARYRVKTSMTVEADNAHEAEQMIEKAFGQTFQSEGAEIRVHVRAGAKELPPEERGKS